jgi:hypothetical protein
MVFIFAITLAAFSLSLPHERCLTLDGELSYPQFIVGLSRNPARNTL